MSTFKGLNDAPDDVVGFEFEDDAAPADEAPPSDDPFLNQSADSLLFEGLGGTAEPAPDATETPVAAPVDENPSPTTPAATTGLPADAASLQRNIDAAVAQRLQQQQEAQQAEDYNRWLGSLTHEQYGQVMRQQQAQMAQYQSVHDAALARYYQETTSAMYRGVPELAKLTPEENARIDPRQFGSFADYLSATAQLVAEKRSAGIIDAKVEERVAAKLAEQMADISRQFPKPVTRTGSPAGHDNPLPFASTTGEDLIGAGLFERSKA